MHQVPQPIWNEIAKTQKISRPLWSRLFRAKDPQPLLDDLEAKLEAAGCDARMIRAYLLVAPLLDESQAISRFLEKTGRTDLRNSMPELTSPNEAVMLASQEYRLTLSQTRKLRSLLSAFPTT